MILTPRCVNILRLLQAARWLSTPQIQRRFFPGVTPDAVRKRLRKLTRAGYLGTVRQSPMSPALFRLGPAGKRLLEESGADGIPLERTLPAQIDHLLGINDLRLTAELTSRLDWFFACWELSRLRWPHAIIPDGLMSLADRTFALEFDRGGEGSKIVQTKFAAYRKGLPGFPIYGVLVVVDRASRMAALAKAAGESSGVLFSTVDLVRNQGFSAPIFYAQPGGMGIGIA